MTVALQLVDLRLSPSSMRQCDGGDLEAVRECKKGDLHFHVLHAALFVNNVGTDDLPKLALRYLCEALTNVK